MMRKFTAWAPAVMVCLSLMVGCSQQGRIDRELASGNEHLAAGAYAKAEEAYIKILSVLPSEPNALGRLGILRLREGRFVQAYAYLKEAVQQRPDEPDFQLAYGLASYALGRRPDAQAAARAVLHVRPNDLEALLLLADSCVTTRDSQAAVKLVQELQSAHGDSTGYHLALAGLYRAQRNFAPAEQAVRAALAVDPESAAAHAELSNLLAAKGDQAASAEALARAAALSPWFSDTRIRHAARLAAAGAREPAAAEIEAVLAKVPNRVPALALRMKLAVEAARLQEAAADGRKILELDPNHLEAMMQLAAIKLAQRDLDGVIAELKRAEAVYERAPSIKFQLAVAYMGKGEHYSAENALNEALRLAPDFEDAQLLLAELQLRKGNWLGAIALLQPLAERKPELRRAQLLLIQAHRGKGDPRESLRVLRHLIERDPTNPENHFLLALEFRQLDAGASRQALEHVVSLAPNHWPAQRLLLEEDLRSGRVAEAAHRVETLLAANPKDAVPWFMRARVRTAADDLAGAEADLHQAIGLNPNLQLAYLQLARIYHRTGRGDEAVAALADSAARSQSAAAYTQLGMLHAALGRHDEAQQAYERALELEEDFAPALNNLAALLADHGGDLERASRLARRANERSPGNPYFEDTLGWVLFRQRQFASALGLIESSARNLPEAAEVTYHLAMVRYFLDQEAIAKDTFERVLGLDAGPDVQADARRRLEVLSLPTRELTPEQRARLEEQLRHDSTDVAALWRLGQDAFARQEFDEAAARLEEVLKINPRSVRSLVALVELYSDAKPDLARARLLAKEARSVAPNDGEVGAQLGALALRMGDAIWAVGVLQEAVRALPQRSDVQLVLAEALYAAGRADEAGRLLRELSRSDIPDEARRAAEQFLTLLTAAENLAPTAEVEELANRILATHSGHGLALMVRGAARERAADFGGAREIYEGILRNSPDFAPASRRLAFVLAEHLADDARAEELALRARQTNPDDPVLAHVLGAIEYRRGDYERATSLLRQAVRSRPEHAPSLFLLGMCFYYTKNTPESRAHLQRAIAAGLPPQEETEAERVLQELSGTAGAF